MAGSDSDGPPPLAGDDSDSSGPPPLADSSSEEDRRPVQQEEETSEEEDSEEDNFAQLFQAMQQRAGFGAGWRQAPGVNHRPLALGDRRSAAELQREEARKAEEERQRQQQEEDRRKREEAARKRAQLASLSDAYRQAKSTEKKALDQKDVLKRMQELEACCEECEELISKVHVIAVTEKDIAGEAKKTETLAIALQADCYARWSLCETPAGHNGRTPLDLAQQASEACAQLLSANSATLGQGLKSRLNAIRARVHVAFGFAHLRLQNEEKAKEEARAAKKYELLSLGECKKLEALLHEEERKIEEKAKEDIGGETVNVCDFGCGFKFPANATRKDRAAHRNQCEFRPDKCPKCSQTGFRVCDRERHYAEACTARLEPCPGCSQMIRKDALAKHLKEECEEREVRCNLHADGCTWEGPLSLKAYHAEACPYNMTQCQYCLEDMREWEMQQHRCPLADGSEDCVICCEQLFTKPVAMLMKTTGMKCSRTCDHFQMHVDCAMEWRSRSLSRKFAKGNSDQVVSECPHCNREYDLVNVLPDFLVVPPEESEIRAATSEVQALVQTAAPATVQKSRKNKKPEASTQPKVVPEPSQKPIVAKSKAQVRQAIPEKVVSPTFRGPSSAPKSKAPILPRPKVESSSASTSMAFQPKPRMLASNQVAKTPEVSLRPETVSAGSTVADVISCEDDLGVIMEYAEAVIRMHGITPSWAELEHRRPAIPQSMRPNPQRYQDYSDFHLPPTEIHFCHDAVSEKFGAFRDSNGVHQVNKTILDTVKEMAEAALARKRLPLEPIKVVWYTEDDWPRWTVAASFNRRLVVYRLLSIFMPDYFRNMRVRRVPLDSVKWYHTSGPMKGMSYHSTRCYGVYVEVVRSSGRYVGKNFEPQDEDEYGVRWPAAYTLFRGLKAKAIAMSR